MLQTNVATSWFAISDWDESVILSRPTCIVTISAPLFVASMTAQEGVSFYWVWFVAKFTKLRLITFSNLICASLELLWSWHGWQQHLASQFGESLYSDMHAWPVFSWKKNSSHVTHELLVQFWAHCMFRVSTHSPSHTATLRKVV